MYVHVFQRKKNIFYNRCYHKWLYDVCSALFEADLMSGKFESGSQLKSYILPTFAATGLHCVLLSLSTYQVAVIVSSSTL